MRRKREAYLWDILDAINSIQAFAQRAGGEDRVLQDLTQAAIERKLEIMGKP